MKFGKKLLAACAVPAALLAVPVPGASAQLVLAADGTSDYQVVVPDHPASPVVGAWLEQVARLVQAAFAANGFTVPVATESGRDPAKPGIYLGDTVFARAAGIDAAAFSGWGYAHKVVGRDIVIAGHDHDPPATDGRFYHRLGTAKGTVDFLRRYAGTRFLYPETTGNIEAAAAPAAVGRVDFAASPAVEFLPTPEISVPADLDLRFTPVILYCYGPRRLNFYDLAVNMFPLVDDARLAHTWDKAVTVEGDYEAHPEWFALIGGQRVRRGQFCLSNPGFQERLYQWTRGWLDRGFRSVNILQPDGFQPCQCADCHALYGTGDDWSEKIWLFYRSVAERLGRDVPGGQLLMSAYTLTARPPTSFASFPDNVSISLAGTNEDELATWGEFGVPGGFFAGTHNWIPNLGTRYTPMRTPLFLEAQARRWYQFNILGVGRDGLGIVFGLEGPAYYAWGRMFDDPENNRASDLVLEFVEPAFGAAAAPMRRFYDQLYHGIELYANYLGTRNPAWSYQPVSGRGRKHLSDPFQLLGFLYPPNLLEALDRELVQAEGLAGTDKVRARLALVRREFEYVRHLARVIHLYHAHRVAPDDPAVYALLLDVIDARNAYIDGLFGTDSRGRSQPTPLPGWPGNPRFPPAGHSAGHLRLAEDGYQSPFRNTCLNWDTAALRATPPVGPGR